MRPLAADVARSVVCVLSTRVNYAKTAEMMIISSFDSCGSKEPRVIWGPDTPREGKAAMRTFAELPWTLAIIPMFFI